MTSDWMKKWRESFKPTTERSNAKPMQTRITFDTQVKTALIAIFVLVIGCNADESKQMFKQLLI